MNYYHLTNLTLHNEKIYFTVTFTVDKDIKVLRFDAQGYHDDSFFELIDLEYNLSKLSLNIIDQLLYDKYKTDPKFKAKIDKGCKETLKKRLKEIQQGK